MEKKYQTYDELHDDSIKNPESFWGNQMKRVDWLKTPTKILDKSNAPFYRWYSDGKLNITLNCIDRHAETNPDKIAFIYEGPIAKKTETMTYAQLKEKVSLFAGVLASKGLKKGDRAIVYMPMILESAVCILACARLGVIHSIVFGGFSSKELSNRIIDSKAKVILSASCGLEPHKIVNYPQLIEKALELSNNVGLTTIFVNRPQNLLTELKTGQSLYEEEMKTAVPHDAVEVESNHPLYILYTSGTTGQPKGIVRDTGGTAVALMLSMELGFGFGKDSVMFATSDIGWVVGHSYIIYGPLLWGGTSIFYEGKPCNTPDVGAYFRIVEQYKVDVLYSSPTAIRAIRKEDPEGEVIAKYDISTLRVLGMVGERTDIYTYEFIKKLVPDTCLYNDTYWQTETGWFISANFDKPHRFTTKGGSCTKAYPGYDIHIVSDEKKIVDEPRELGHVNIKLPMPPSFMLSLWENDEAFVKKYLSDFEGYYYTGDVGYFDEDRYLHIMTRTDDLIQVAGHRLSTAQIEEVLISHPNIAEAVVVGLKDSLKGQIPFGVLVFKKGQEKPLNEILKELIHIVRREIGAVAFFKNAAIAEKLPKTRSGKILRKTIRKILDNEEYTVPSTIEDLETLDYIKKIGENLNLERTVDIKFDDDLHQVQNKKVKME